MKTVSLDRFEIIRLSQPNARIEERDGIEYVVIPTYNYETDQTGEHLLLLDRADSDKTTSFKPGDVLRHTKTGSPFNIVDPITKLFMKVRKGPKAE